MEPESEPEPRNTELEAAILEDPARRMPWRVYADWLLDQGCLRGELVASMAGFTRGERTDELMRTYPQQFLGPLADPEHARWVTWDWLPGFWRSLTLARPPAVLPLLERLLAHPSASLLGTLNVQMDAGAGEWSSVVEVVLARANGEALRALALSGSDGRGVDRYELSPSALGPLLASTRLPRLERLVLAGTTATDELPGLLLRSPLLPGLRHLDLSGGRLTDRGAGVLLAEADRFRHLEVLDLQGNRVSRLADALKGALPCVRVTALPEIRRARRRRA